MKKETQHKSKVKAEATEGHDRYCGCVQIDLSLSRLLYNYVRPRNGTKQRLNEPGISVVLRGGNNDKLE